MKLRSKLLERKMYQKLAEKLKGMSYTHGELPTLIIGKYSNPNSRFHEPSPGIGLKRKLKELGFSVFLIDEFISSTTCCEFDKRTVSTFRRIPNPRHYRRENTPRVMCHCLLR